MISRLLRKIFSKLGYSLSRNTIHPDVDLYAALYTPESIRTKAFYNFGGGNWSHPCWTVVDLKPSGQADVSFLQHDLFAKHPIPIADQSAELIYTSHTLGHINDEAIGRFFAEAKRILKKGGILRIAVADAELMYRAWKRNDLDFFYWRNWDKMNTNFQNYALNIPLKESTITQLMIEELTASASSIAAEGASERVTDDRFFEMLKTKSFEEVMDYCAALCPVELQYKYPFRHMNWFSAAKLESMLRNAGFSEVYRSGYRQSAAAVMRNADYFDLTTPGLSLYMEAVV